MKSPMPIYEKADNEIVCGDYRNEACPENVAVVMVDPPYGLGKNYADERETVPFFSHVVSLVKWSTAPWTFVFAPLPTCREWLPKIPPPTRILWWCKTFAQIRRNSTWQHAVTPILVYQREGAPWYYPNGIVPDYFVCGSSMSDIRLTKHFFRGVHPGVTGTPIATEILPSVSQVGDLVFDPMCGIGSVLVAAQRLGRRVRGFEIVPEYAVAARAWLSSERLRAPARIIST